MTVLEVIARLMQQDPHAMVYVPDNGDKLELCVEVVRVRHLDLPDDLRGIAISDDVALVTARVRDEAATFLDEDDPDAPSTPH